MKIYTRTGDKGTSGLFGGQRVPKTHPRLEAYGTVDELNSLIGTIANQWPDVADELMDIQRALFTIGSHLATPNQPNSTLAVSEVLELEQSIDVMTAELPELRKFILPGGQAAACTAHFARTVCRRAERLIIALMPDETIDPLVVQYMNRLSDWLFTLARSINHKTNTTEVTWN
ncbi:MAG TPA: cob(I)yrinic acid a,c-diamide adenosyltransferase [Candidatus Kerfeldbacteria bacterium]|nr:cob(I)yrinic acid a,c-diamide adenosyltransferase [Candidatus Kerfeldbacteria bacterium]